MKRCLFLIGLLFVSTSASALEYHGYLRSGLGFSRNGTDQQCYSAVGSEFGKFRLGNECETYIEMALSENHGAALDSGKPSFQSHVRFALVSQAHRDWEPTDSYCDGDCSSDTLKENLTVSLREAYGVASNVLPWNGKFWVGKRFYQRRDIHILDYYYLANAGPGFGFESFDFGSTKAHFAVTRNVPQEDNADGPAQTNLDLRADMAVGAGTFSPVLIYGTSSDRGHSSGDKKWEALAGYQVGLFYQFNLLGGFNMTGLRFGSGLFGGNMAWNSSTIGQFGGYGSQNIALDDEDAKNAREDSQTVWFADQFTIKPMSNLSTDIVAIYQSVDFGGPSDVKAKAETAFGLRPVWHAQEGFDVALEYGMSSVKDHRKSIKAEGGGADTVIYEDSVLHKITLAPQFTPDSSYWARPQLRLFATYASWNDDSKGAIGGDVYSTVTKGFSTGAQVEAWW